MKIIKDKYVKLEILEKQKLIKVIKDKLWKEAFWTKSYCLLTLFYTPK